jgi:hypothetical protein
VLALATPCADYERCWHPVPAPDAFPFVPWWVAGLWALALITCVLLFAHRLGRD